LGYRMVAQVGPWIDAAAPSGAQSRDSAAPRDTASFDATARRAVAGRPLLAAASGVAAMLILAFVVYGRIGSRVNAAATPVAEQKSIAVLPFLDLTSESMDQEYFADGMTEELIDKLSKIPGLRVPPPTSSFYFKGKKISIAEIAKSLGVAYILDGSLRQSGATMRVAARLVRADNGFVVWSETYDRRSDDALKVQADIAGEVATALEGALALR